VHSRDGARSIMPLACQFQRVILRYITKLLFSGRVIRAVGAGGMMKAQLRSARGVQDSGTLAGKVIVVTGGSRGIGRAIAIRLAREGGKLILAARDAAALYKVVAEITASGGMAVAFPADLRLPESGAALVAGALTSYGAIDIVVNNAGAAKRGEFTELTDADWVDGFALKFFGAVRLVRAAWPHLKERRGAVLNIVGVGGRTPGGEFTIGGSVNGAALSFTKALSDVGIRDGVQVNAINPGWVRTDRLRGFLETAAAQHGGDIEAAASELSRKSNIVRLGEPDDIANLAAYILSPQGRLLQGALIDLDGGQTKTV
jgi:NAD(P)-dependent dehydrogenase (short-subunit alcohol dehydrogenase family)